MQLLSAPREGRAVRGMILGAVLAAWSSRRGVAILMRAENVITWLTHGAQLGSPSASLARSPGRASAHARLIIAAVR